MTKLATSPFSVVLYSTKAAAERLGISESSLARYRHTGMPYIPHVRIGPGRGVVKYLESDLDAYVASVRTPTLQK